MGQVFHIRVVVPNREALRTDRPVLHSPGIPLSTD